MAIRARPPGRYLGIVVVVVVAGTISGPWMSGLACDCE